jgi:hypothetical protein
MVVGNVRLQQRNAFYRRSVIKHSEIPPVFRLGLFSFYQKTAGVSSRSCPFPASKPFSGRIYWTERQMMM